jgi:PBSX family phage terminase large subunit
VTTATARQIDPRTKPYRPFGGALTLFYCKDEEILVDGPAGTGKTRAVLEKLHLCLCKYAGARVLALRKTRSSMTQSILVTFEEKVLPDGSPIKTGANREQRSRYVYPNGSELVLGGLDNADRIMSTEFDIIAVFEATEATEDDWERLSTRLRNGVMPYQQIIAECNPAGQYHWLNQRALQGRMTRILSRHRDNPTVSDAYLKRLGQLTGARRERLLEGKWANQEGLVYDDFDVSVHVIPNRLVPVMPAGWETWDRIRSIDFGYTNPFVCQWWAIDPDGRLYLYREIYRTRRLVEDHAKDILRLSGEERYSATVADHDAEDRATLERHGVKTTAAKKAVTPGIQAVQARLLPAGDGRPRIFLLEGALLEPDPELVDAKKPTCTVQEFDGYAWPKGVDGKAQKEEPVKVDDHGMDTMRYAVAHFDLASAEPFFLG